MTDTLVSDEVLVTSPIYRTRSFIHWMGQNFRAVTFIFLANAKFRGIQLSPWQHTTCLPLYVSNSNPFCNDYPKRVHTTLHVQQPSPL